MRRFTFVFAALNLISLVAAPAEAGWPFGRRVQGYQATGCVASVGYVSPTGQYVGQAAQPGMVAVQPVAYSSPAAAQGQVIPVSYTRSIAQPAGAAVTASGDAYGFTGWLNATRTSHGLPAVGYDATVEADCRRNNLLQAAYGMGHHFMGCHRRQNAAMGLGFPGVEAAWMASPGHCSALLDPTIRMIGIAWYGGFCTFGAY